MVFLSYNLELLPCNVERPIIFTTHTLTLKIPDGPDSGPVSVFKVQVQGIDVLDIKPLFSLIL